MASFWTSKLNGSGSLSIAGNAVNWRVRAGGTGSTIYNAEYVGVRINSTHPGVTMLTLAARASGSSPAALSSGDPLWEHYATGHDGTSYYAGAKARVVCAAAPSSGVIPTKWEWYTTSTGGATLVQARLDSAAGLTLTIPLAVTSGGTGGTSAATARTNLGLAYADVTSYTSGTVIQASDWRSIFAVTSPGEASVVSDVNGIRNALNRQLDAQVHEPMALLAVLRPALTVFVSSAWAFQPSSGIGAYVSARAAQSQLVRCLLHDGYKIIVSEPGAIAGPIWDHPGIHPWVQAAIPWLATSPSSYAASLIAFCRRHPNGGVHYGTWDSWLSHFWPTAWLTGHVLTAIQRRR